MTNIIKILQLFIASNPIKKFNFEYQLMLSFGGRIDFLRKYLHRCIYYVHNSKISHSAKNDYSVNSVHFITVAIRANTIHLRKDI